MSFFGSYHKLGRFEIGTLDDLFDLTGTTESVVQDLDRSIAKVCSSGDVSNGLCSIGSAQSTYSTEHWYWRRYGPMSPRSRRRQYTASFSQPKL